MKSVFEKELEGKLWKTNPKEYKKQWRIKNKEKIAEYQKEWYKNNYNKKKRSIKNRLWREQHKEYDKQYVERNKRKITQYRKKYRDNFSRGNHRKDWLAWSKKNPIKCQIRRQRRKERINNRIHNYTQEEWTQKLEYTFGICPRCKEDVGINKLTLDHNPPLSKAPINFIYTINEIQPLCSSCNSSKGDKIEEKL